MLINVSGLNKQSRKRDPLLVYIQQVGMGMGVRTVSVYSHGRELVTHSSFAVSPSLNGWSLIKCVCVNECVWSYIREFIVIVRENTEGEKTQQDLVYRD